jgi:hypothetical protein
VKGAPSPFPTSGWERDRLIKKKEVAFMGVESWLGLRPLPLFFKKKNREEERQGGLRPPFWKEDRIKKIFLKS